MALSRWRALSLATRSPWRHLSTAPPPPSPPPPNPKADKDSPKLYRQRLLDGGEEVLTEGEKKEKDEIIKELTRRLSGPLADEDGNVPTGEDRPVAIEVDGPSHFYANSKRYTAYTKLKHRLLTRMGYKVLHVPYYEWRSLRGAVEREDYMKKKLKEEPTEWLDPEDEKYYMQGPEEGEEEFSVKPDAETDTGGSVEDSWPSTPGPPPRSKAASSSSSPSPPPGRARPPTPRKEPGKEFAVKGKDVTSPPFPPPPPK
mmetsp:Transcript_16573/g.31308  ORF Transcript_16573/g.31308 Transcript_16573/m.31308 type:complete len:257 (+) Transcript_16573:27-797(+)